jgi:hypothetical protein
MDRNRSRGDGKKIGDLYEWEALHHVHCIARAHHSRAPLDGVVGTFIALPADVRFGYPLFDYADMYEARTILLRVGGVVFFAVLNDAGQVGATFPRLHRLLEADEHALTPLQIRELYAHLVYRNLSLLSRPTFYTELVPRFRIVSERPDCIEIRPVEEPAFGKLLRFLAEPYLAHLEPAERAKVEASLEEGRSSFFADPVPLFPEDNRFGVEDGATETNK